MKDKAHIKAVDIIIGDMCDELKNKMKEKIPNDSTKTMGLYSVVSGAKYDLSKKYVSVVDSIWIEREIYVVYERS